MCAGLRLRAAGANHRVEMSREISLSPFTLVTIPLLKECTIRRPEQEPIRLNIASDTRRGRYKYVVAVFDGSNVWIEDPWMIVMGLNC